MPGWYGILAETESKAAFWNGTDWAEYPRRAYARSMKAFDTEEAALEWTGFQPDSISHEAYSRYATTANPDEGEIS
jgi:hypothetical protein